MFEQFFLGIQQDIKLFVLFPLLCAFFRAFFILKYKPYSLRGRWKAVWHCFRFGFWWGMDYNAYVFLFSMLFITLPGLVFPFWENAGDMLRLLAGLIYSLILYVAFVAKMIFYANFHDIFNHIVRLGRNAEKHNLLDVFFSQHHGFFILFEVFPYMIGCTALLAGLLSLPSIPYPSLPTAETYLLNMATVVIVALGFYFFRYGGTLNHENKPEWDTIPDDVKEDPFLSKACVDDLVSFGIMLDNPLNDTEKKTDEENFASIRVLIERLGGTVDSKEGALEAIKHTAKGVRLKRPSHIFLIVGESYTQYLFDPAFASLHVADAGKAILADPHTVGIETALSAGVISRPSIVSLMMSIFDAGLELNEREIFWKKNLHMAMPRQLRRLGYTSTYWYGGSLAHGNFTHFAKACGFDTQHAGTDICPDAPKSWVGVYDHLFLEKCADMILADQNDMPQFHFIYTTSNHSPYKLPLKKLGYQTEEVMPDAPKDIKSDKTIQKAMGTFWYSDRAIGQFVVKMKEAYPDSLFIITGDHANVCRHLETTSLMHREFSFRELHSPVLMIHHRAITKDMFAGNTIGGHMNILPTILELIAPKGFEYFALAKPLTEPIDYCVTPSHWLTKEAMGGYDNNLYQDLTSSDGLEVKTGTPPFQDICDAEKSLTAFLVKHPEYLMEVEQESGDRSQESAD